MWVNLEFHQPCQARACGRSVVGLRPAVLFNNGRLGMENKPTRRQGKSKEAVAE